MFYGPIICTYMIFKMFPENFTYQIFNITLYCFHIDLALQVSLAQLSHLLNLISEAKIDGEIEERINLEYTDIGLAHHMHYIKQSTQ